MKKSVGGPMRSLVVEDEFTSRTQLGMFLGEFGPCDSAVNVDKALKAFKDATLYNKAPYDLVCIDLHLQSGDGYEVLSGIRDFENSLPKGGRKSKVFITTSHSSKDNVIRAFEGKCDEFLLKPLTRDKLHIALKKHSFLR